MKKRMILHIPNSSEIVESVEPLDARLRYELAQSILMREGYTRHAYTPCDECHKPTEYTTAHRINHQFFCPACAEAIESGYADEAQLEWEQLSASDNRSPAVYDDSRYDERQDYFDEYADYDENEWY